MFRDSNPPLGCQSVLLFRTWLRAQLNKKKKAHQVCAGAGRDTEAVVTVAQDPTSGLKYVLQLVLSEIEF